MGQAKRYVDELLKLPPNERSDAAEALLISLEEEGDEPGVEQAWAEEIDRRVVENAPGVSADLVFAEGRARLKNEP